MTGLGQLDPLGPFKQRRWKGCALRDVPEKQFPAGAIAVAEWLHLRQLLSVLVEDHRLRPFRVEEWLRRGHQRLHEAAVKTAHR